MTVDQLLAALDLPDSSRVDRRVPKKLLVENGAVVAADKRLIDEGVEELRWIAALKPTTVAIPEYRDGVREYLEIAVLSLILDPDGKAPRLLELVHRAIPYPVVLVSLQSKTPGISLAHKRWSQGEAAKTVIDGDVTKVEWADGHDDKHEQESSRPLPCRSSQSVLYWLFTKGGSTALWHWRPRVEPANSPRLDRARGLKRGGLHWRSVRDWKRKLPDCEQPPARRNKFHAAWN